MSDTKQPLLAHLEALRKSLVRCAIAVAVATGLALIFTKQIFNLLLIPAGHPNLIYLEVTEMITTYFKVAITAGFIVAMPYVIWETVWYVAPALTPKEKRYVYIVLPWVCLMFVAGVVFGYYVLLPPGLHFLLTFGNDIATPQIRVGNYVAVVSKLLLAIGLVFELPVITTFLARIGVVSSRGLAKQRKWAVVGAFVVSAIITPTPDPINQIMVAVPLVILYEMGIWLALFVQPNKEGEKASTVARVKFLVLTIGSLVIIAAVLFALNYFNVISLESLFRSLSFLPHRVR